MLTEDHVSAPALPISWSELLAGLPPGLDLDQTARDTKALVRARRVRCAEDLLRLVCVYAASDFSLRSTAAWAEVANVASLSDVALLNRIDKAADWLALLLQHTLTHHLQTLRPPKIGRHIRLVDASTLSIDGANDRYWRLHLSMRLDTLSIDAVELTDENTGEHLTRFTVAPGDLMIADAGYARYTGIAHLVQHGADCLLRHHWQSLPLLDAQGERFDYLGKLAAIAPGEIREFAVQARPGAHKKAEPIAGRLLVLAKPPAVAAKARRALARRCSKKQVSPKPETVRIAGYVLLFTTVEASVASAEELLALYRLRWQIELGFKRLKSLLSLEQIRAHRPGVIRSCVLATLLMGVWMEGFGLTSDFPPWKPDIALASDPSVLA